MGKCWFNFWKGIDASASALYLVSAAVALAWCLVAPSSYNTPNVLFVYAILGVAILSFLFSFATVCLKGGKQLRSTSGGLKIMSVVTFCFAVPAFVGAALVIYTMLDLYRCEVCPACPPSFVSGVSFCAQPCFLGSNCYSACKCTASSCPNVSVPSGECFYEANSPWRVLSFVVGASALLTGVARTFVSIYFRCKTHDLLGGAY